MPKLWVQEKFVEAIKAGSVFWARFYHLLGADVNQTFNFSEFHFSRHLSKKEFVLEEGAFTPLMWSILNGCGKSMQHFLINKGAKLNAYIASQNCWYADSNLKGYCALALLITFCPFRDKEEMEDAILGLIADGAEIDNSPVPGNSPLAIAKRRDVELASLMLCDFMSCNPERVA
jgi:hypothetical protein